ncbi:MAG: hypothetical protein K6A92_08025 [Lachnospiraceae bacterium]|nr:hypothetical protein [Lachnospiraceae bacterium]
MKRRVTRFLASLGVVAMVLLVPMSAAAQERSYTYIYDWWGDVQDAPDSYTVSRVFTSTDLGLDVNLKSPQGLTVCGERLFIVDTGNNRIIELSRPTPQTLQVERIIDSFNGGSGPNTFSNPLDIQVSEDGNLFICDNGNARIVKLDNDLNFLEEFTKPNDSSLDPGLIFQPTKLAVDTAERVYCLASGINKGMVKYEADGEFSGFVGATPVTYNFMDYLWKKFATQEQRAQMQNFVPTQYDNIYMDYEGFIYAVTGTPDQLDIKNGSADVVRKLNLMGSDILVRNGEWYIIGDLYMGNGGGYEGASYFADVTCFDNDIYVCLDRNRGRLFGYDDQGNMVYAFGGNGNMDGYFRRPVAIDHMGYDLFVLDELDCAVTLFTVTEFGQLVYQAIDEFDLGNYEASEASWRQVMALDGNYDLAYIGIGRALLRQEQYREAMDYFEVKYDDENYSKAYKQYRKQWVEEHIKVIVAVILILVIVPLIIGRYRAIKEEFKTAEVFRYYKK